MQNTPETDALISTLEGLSPSGYAVALHVHFTTPHILLQTYDPEWIKIYSSEGYLMDDPTVHWGFSNIGAIRWSAIDAPDPRGIMEKAVKYGMKFGLSVACEVDGTRSIASFTRADREYSDDEIKQIETALIKLHHATVPSE